MKNNNTLGLIFSENTEANLGELMRVRSLAAVPVGGRYRIVDFVLSNMINSGISNVGITSGFRNRSLIDHVGSGRAWDMARKETGLFILPPPENTDMGGRIAGEIDFLWGAMSFLDRSRQEYVMLADCNTVCNIDFEKVRDFHFEKEADITVVCGDAPQDDSRKSGRYVTFDAEDGGRVSDVHINPRRWKWDSVYLNMFFMKKSLLVELIEDCMAHGEHSIAKDIFSANVNKRKIFAYRFCGYNKRIDSVRSFYELNLDLLETKIRDELFGKESGKRIFTKVKDSVPTKYGKEAEVRGSFIADGCVIEGYVENSVIFRGVKVGKGAVVRNSIIMQKSRIMDGCNVNNAIFDKEVILMNGKKLSGERTYPLVVGKKIVV